MKSQNNPTYHIFIEGRVQGVGYRRFAQKNAQNLSLIGWARNLIDGRVEIMVQGPDDILEKYCEVLRQGPTFSQVREVLVKILDEDAQGIENKNEFLILADVEPNYK